MKRIDADVLDRLITQKHLEDLDLYDIDIHGKDFTGCTIINVVFSKEKQKDRVISNAIFKDAKLKNVDFSDARLQNIQFDNAVMDSCSFQIYNNDNLAPTIAKVSFAETVMNKCRFRNSIIEWSDFRYAEITNTTFEGSNIAFCDFYRAHFSKINIFSKAIIANSSLNYTLFEGTIIRKSNIANGIILQQDENSYKKFLVEWKENGPGVRKTTAKTQWEPNDLSKEIAAMPEHAENIFKSLNALWAGHGFLGDANWAYVQGRRAERKRMRNELKLTLKSKERRAIMRKILWNYFCDCSFGYGESIYKIVRAYIFIIAIFACLLYFIVPLNSIMYSFLCSFFNMIAQTPAELKTISIGTTILNVIQSSLGILMTGIFGFVIANKIRNQ